MKYILKMNIVMALTVLTEKYFRISFEKKNHINMLYIGKQERKNADRKKKALSMNDINEKLLTNQSLKSDLQ